MSDKVTSRQKQFLRQLGYKSDTALTKVMASKLIEKFLAEEKESGKQFSCPYCKAKFGPRPKRQVKCKSCSGKIIHLSGRFYTEEKANEKFQKDWFKEERSIRTTEVKEEWREEKSYRREMSEPFTVGFIVKAGPNCPHARSMEGLLILIEDAYDTPDFLPPYDACQEDRCECEFETISNKEVPKNIRIAEWEDPKMQAKLKTRKSSPVALKQKSGCLLIFLMAPATIIFYLLVSALIFSGCGPSESEKTKANPSTSKIRFEQPSNPLKHQPSFVSNERLQKPYVTTLHNFPPSDPYQLIEGVDSIAHLDFNWSQSATIPDRLPIDQARNLISGFKPAIIYQVDDARILETHSKPGELKERWQEQFNVNYDNKWARHGPAIYYGLAEDLQVSEFQLGKATGRSLIYSVDRKLEQAIFRVEGVRLRERQWDKNGKLILKERWEWEGLPRKIVEYQSSKD